MNKDASKLRYSRNAFVKMMILSAFSLLLLALPFLSGCSQLQSGAKKEERKTLSKDLSIYITSDLHYLSDDINDHGPAFQKYISVGDGKQLQYIEAITDALVYEVKQTTPDVLIISGDLTSNGEKESHKDLAKKLKSIEKDGTSVYVIPGNHDINNPWARGFKKNKQYVTDDVNAKEFLNLYEDFGYKEAISRDQNTLSYLVAISKDVWLLMLDTSKYENNKSLGFPQADGAISKGTFDWMAECTKLAYKNNASIVTVMHHNVLHHSEVIQDGYTLNNNEQTKIKLKENQLSLVFSGHIHIQDISSDLNLPEKPIYDVASNALSVYPHQYGVIRYRTKDNSIEYSTTRLDVEAWARNNKSDDERLLNFTSYSKEYFSQTAYDMAYKNLKENENLTKEELTSIADTMRTLNCRYFAGTEYLNSDLFSEENIMLWDKLGDSFIKTYIYSILTDQDMDDNSLHLPLRSSNAVIE